MQPDIVKVRVKYSYTIEVDIPEDQLNSEGQIPNHVVYQYVPQRAKVMSWEVLDKKQS